MILSGLGYSLLNGAVWTIYSLICKNEIFGTSMGVLYSLMSLGFAASYYIMDLLIDVFIYETYRVSNLFLAALCAISVILILILNCFDSKHTGILHEKKKPLLPIKSSKSE